MPATVCRHVLVGHRSAKISRIDASSNFAERASLPRLFLPAHTNAVVDRAAVALALAAAAPAFATGTARLPVERNTRVRLRFGGNGAAQWLGDSAFGSRRRGARARRHHRCGRAACARRRRHCGRSAEAQGEAPQAVTEGYFCTCRACHQRVDGHQGAEQAVRAAVRSHALPLVLQGSHARSPVRRRASVIAEHTKVISSFVDTSESAFGQIVLRR
eukprot:4375179-Prymnesium_polylepis.1